MTTLVPIEFATEREIVAGLVLELLQKVKRHYFPELEFLDAVELALVGAYVFLAQQDRRPCTVSYLSRKTGLPRATVRRRTAHLIELGYVESSSGYYFMGRGFAKPRGRRRIVQAHIAAINSAAKNWPNWPQIKPSPLVIIIFVRFKLNRVN